MSITMSVRAASLTLAGLAAALPAAAQPSHEESRRLPGRALAPLERPLHLESSTMPARQALAALSAAARIRVRAAWSDAADGLGLDPEARVTLPASGATLPTILELVLPQCDTGAGGGTTWQVGEDGAIEIGPRASLNRRPVVRIYDIRDLLARTPDFPEAATLDLQAALQACNNSAVLRENDLSERPEHHPDQDLLDLITQIIEPDQWWITGGEATVRVYGGQLVVRAPAYIQRQIAGPAGAVALPSSSRP